MTMGFCAATWSTSRTIHERFGRRLETDFGSILRLARDIEQDDERVRDWYLSVTIHELGDKTAQYAALRSFAGKILVITGDQDNIIPTEHIARIRSLLPAHTHVSVPAEHNLLLTHPEIVVDALLAWSRHQSS